MFLHNLKYVNRFPHYSSFGYLLTCFLYCLFNVGGGEAHLNKRSEDGGHHRGGGGTLPSSLVAQHWACTYNTSHGGFSHVITAASASNLFHKQKKLKHYYDNFVVA